MAAALTDDGPAPDWRTRVVVVAPFDAAAPADRPAPDALATTLGVPCVEAPDPERFQLHYDPEGRLVLQPPASAPDLGRLPLVVDFLDDPRFAKPMAAREPLARAVGIKGGSRPQVIDLTAGLGRDAWSLASTGCPVLAFERHPLVYALLDDGLARARLAGGLIGEIAARIDLRAGDVRDLAVTDQGDALLVSLGAAVVWLLDPMFPERRKSALVKKDMRVFQQLVGGDEDAPALYAWARTRPGLRWIVKRPVGAPELSGMEVAVRYEGGRVRFDCVFAS